LTGKKAQPIENQQISSRHERLTTGIVIAKFGFSKWVRRVTMTRKALENDSREGV
jgi:hypothetical protein